MDNLIYVMSIMTARSLSRYIHALIAWEIRFEVLRLNESVWATVELPATNIHADHCCRAPPPLWGTWTRPLHVSEWLRTWFHADELQHWKLCNCDRRDIKTYSDTVLSFRHEAMQITSYSINDQASSRQVSVKCTEWFFKCLWMPGVIVPALMKPVKFVRATHIKKSARSYVEQLNPVCNMLSYIVF